MGFYRVLPNNNVAILKKKGGYGFLFNQNAIEGYFAESTSQENQCQKITSYSTIVFLPNLESLRSGHFDWPGRPRQDCFW